MDEVFYVVATQTFVMFTPKIGEIIQVDEHILQLGWFNRPSSIFCIGLEEFPSIAMLVQWDGG